MIDFIIELLQSWANLLPLPLFVFIGAFIEEIIAPVPSPLVMTLGGSLAAAKGMPMVYLLVLAVCGALGKTIGSFIVYWIADKFEHIITGKFGRFIGVTHQQVESLSRRLKGRREWLVVFALRAIPIMPTAPVSFAAGVLELNKRIYLTATFAGVLVRDIFYLYLGFVSAGALDHLNDSLDTFESIGYILILAVIVAIFVLIYRKRRSGL